MAVQTESADKPTYSKPTIIGLGKTGVSCARFFAEHNEPFAICDTRQSPPGLQQFQTEFPNIKLGLGNESNDLISHAGTLIVSPGVPLDTPIIAERQAAGIPIIGDVELFACKRQAPIIAITGSNGKTTVTTLVGEMVSAAQCRVEVCGNIGEPILTALSRKKPDYYVCELSSFQLETTYSLAADVATVLNVSPDHMDRYASYHDYILAKQQIFKNCQTAVVNLDDPASWQGAVGDAQRVIGFTLQEPLDNQVGVVNDGQQYLAFGQEKLLPLSSLKLQGQHHTQNALAALALGYAAGLPFEPMLSVLKSFQGVAHRCELVRELDGVVYYNDSKATNVGAACAAINTLGPQVRHLILIAGGDAKAADLSDMLAPCEQYVHKVLLIGRDAQAFAEVFSDKVAYEFVDTLQNAVVRAQSIATAGDCVLLSPACASFDMFDSFEHRGKTFVSAVENL